MKTYFSFLFIVFYSISSSAQWQYPVNKTVDSVDTYFGVSYKDSFRWLEDMKNPETEAWFKQQADFSNNILNKISGRDELIAEWKELDKLQPPHYNFRCFENGWYFYRKTMPGENVGKAYYREGLNGEEQLMFDPTTYIPGKTLSIKEILPSYDAKKVLISYAEKGGEISTIIIFDIEKRTFLPERIYPSWFGPISWTFDNKSFTYFSQQIADKSSPNFLLNTKTKLHTLGEDVSKDIDFFSNEAYPELNIAENYIPFASLEKDSKNYIFGYLKTVRNEYHCYYAPINQLYSKKKEWKVLCTPKDKLVKSLELLGDKVFAITYNNAPRYKLVVTDLNNPDWEKAQTVVEEKKETLEYIKHSKDFLYLIYSNGVTNSLYKYSLRTNVIKQVILPYSGSVYLHCMDTRTNNCLVLITSWNKPNAEFNYDAEKDIFSPGFFNKPLNYPDAYTDLVTEELEVKGHDGAMVPLSIIYKKGIKLDGTNCCLMEGYGAYSAKLLPFFDIKLNSLAVKGVVIAIAHVRGGGEKGEDWYKAGFKTTKPNTWKDFNSCAEYLISKGFTSTSKLAGQGTSAGGILISRAITERPDLYGAAICNVGVANAMRKEFSANGPANIPEYGTVKDSIECKALYEMDGLMHVVKGTRYPAIICVGGWNDPRVLPWQPAKFAAAMQNASTSGKPVFLKINYDNGHFTDDKSVTYANFADQYAFVFWQLGHPDFKLKTNENMFNPVEK